jgi:DNA-binding NtrC family response regulator
MTTLKQSTTLLLVDDDPDMVRLLQEVIERSFEGKLRIESLTDPTEARERINKGGVDILLTDLDMPGTDGLELLRCAKNRSAWSQVIFLTEHSSQKALLEALEMGATDYLLKPVDQEQLLDLVGQSHQRQMRWREALKETWRQKKELSFAETS